MKLILALGVALAFGACNKKKPDEPPRKAKVCQSNADCDNGWLCLNRECADARSSAIYKHPAQMVTPDKVRKEVERMQNQHGADIDKVLKNVDPAETGR